jgi:two-component system sensor kinase FixL
MSIDPVTQGPLRMVHPQLEGLLNAAIDGVLILDHKGRIRLMSHAAERMFGCREADMLGCDVSHILPEYHDGKHAQLADVQEPRFLDHAWHLQGRRRDGSRFAAELASGKIHGIDPPRYVAFVRDISDRVRREAALRQNESALHTAQRLANIGNYIIHQDASQGDYASPQLRRMFDWDQEGTVSQILVRMLSVVHPADHARVMQVFAELEHDGRSIDIEYRTLSVTSGLRHIHHLAQLLKEEPDGRVQHVGTVHDITDRKLADYELRNMHNRIAHFGRVSTMGEMATGLAHEINQPLTAIASYAQACRRMLIGGTDEIDEITAALEQIAQQALRAGEVIRRMRTFAKYHEAKLETVGANRLLEELVELAQTDAHHHNVRLLVEAAAEMPVVCADAVQIQQVLLNLVRNAIDAMQAIPEPQREIVLRTRVAERGEIEFMVADRGAGLPSELSSEVFTAFFTTKPSGTGLGLSISQSIIKAHGGRLWCTDNPGGGARFFFSLPSGDAARA